MKRIFVSIVTAFFWIHCAQGEELVNFSGSWSSTGVMTLADPFTGNRTIPCEKVEIEIIQDAQKLTVSRYKAVCGSMGSDWGPHVLEIRGTKIFEDGEETGSIEGNLLKTLQSSGGVKYAFNLRLLNETQGQPKILETYYGVKNLSGAIVIEANLDASSM